MTSSPPPPSPPYKFVATGSDILQVQVVELLFWSILSLLLQLYATFIFKLDAIQRSRFLEEREPELGHHWPRRLNYAYFGFIGAFALAFAEGLDIYTIIQGLDFCCCNDMVIYIIPFFNEIGVTLMFLYLFYKAKYAGFFPPHWKVPATPLVAVGVGLGCARAAYFMMESRLLWGSTEYACQHREWATWLQGFIMIACRLLGSDEEE